PSIAFTPPYDDKERPMRLPYIAAGILVFGIGGIAAAQAQNNTGQAGQAVTPRTMVEVGSAHNDAVQNNLDQAPAQKKAHASKAATPAPATSSGADNSAGKRQ